MKPSAQNDELRRLLRAGPPADGNEVPLYRAMSQAELLVPSRHAPQGRVPLVFRGAEGSPPIPSKYVCTFTHPDVLKTFVDSPDSVHGKWDRTNQSLLDMPVAKMGIREVCLDAIRRSIDWVAIDRTGYGYLLGYAEIVHVLSHAAPTARGSVPIKPVSVAYFIPEAPAPAGMLEAIRDLGVSHGLRSLQFCYSMRGEAPPELCLVFAPYSDTAFGDAVLAAMKPRFAGRFTMSTFDAEATPPAIPPVTLRRLLP